MCVDVLVKVGVCVCVDVLFQWECVSVDVLVHVSCTEHGNCVVMCTLMQYVSMFLQYRVYH